MDGLFEKNGWHPQKAVDHPQKFLERPQNAMERRQTQHDSHYPYWDYRYDNI
ncbi:MAG: hypothetical protein Q4E63_00985 [Prevotellaceae bacterium]|nr:hypothetical protein [Prevotellaceae bacterium]